MSSKAESRLIYASISASQRVNSLGVKGALLFTWMVTHCDSQGRINGNPVFLKATVFPLMEEIGISEIEDSIEMMEEQKLVIKYTDSKQRTLIQIADWWDWQRGLKYKAPSRFEPPPGWQDHVTSRDENGRFITEKEEEYAYR